MLLSKLNVTRNDEILIASLLRSDKTRRLWQGDDAGMEGGSEADQYLVTRIAYLTEDLAQVERIYSRSPRADRKSSDGVQKWIKRADYRARCIRSAFSFVESHPNGDLDEARATIEAAIATAKASDDARGIGADDVTAAFSVLQRSAPSDFDHYRTQARKAGAKLATIDAAIKNSGDGSRVLDAVAADLAIAYLGGPENVIFSQGKFWLW